jgi:glyoxylase-like metal-dependent hydrolase (beta-lactamase superfamily II)
MSRTTSKNSIDTTQHLHLGNLEVWVLPDTSFTPDATLFALEATERDITNLLSSEGIASSQLRLSACPLLLNRGGSLILIDAGIGSHVPESPGSLPKKLAEIGIRPEEISMIFITHLHTDHIGGALDPGSGEPLFPNATFYIPEPEASFWKDPDLTRANALPKELVEFTVRTAQRAIDRLPIQTFTFGQEVFPGIEPVALPGHTAGQAGYLLTSPDNGQQLLVGADSMHHPILHLRRPEWTTAGDSHPYLVHHTRLQLLNRLADKNILFRCYHFAAHETGFVRKNPEGGFCFHLPS